MAKRYCGRWIISVTYSDRWSQYECTIAHDTAPGAGFLICVGTPGVLTEAVDSPASFDSAASAALSFATADQDGRIFDSELEYEESGAGGWKIRRKR